MSKRTDHITPARAAEIVRDFIAGPLGYPESDFIRTCAEIALSGLSEPPSDCNGSGDLRDKIEAVLRDYRCQNQREGDEHEEQALPLVDVLSHGYPTIKQGEEEIHLIADAIAAELSEPHTNCGVSDTQRVDALEKWGGAHIINWGADGETGNPWTVDRCCDPDNDIGRFEGTTLRKAIDAAIGPPPARGQE